MLRAYMSSKRALIGALVGALLTASTASSAQTYSCSPTEVGINVVLLDGKNVEGLKVQNFAARTGTKHDSVAIDSLTLDSSPRRILLILDMGRDLAPDARRAQLEIASYLVKEGRPTDSFALLTARGALKKVQFGEGHDAVLSALTELRDKKGGSSTDNGILDAVMEGIGYWQKPALGDAIMVMASEIENNKSTHYAQVAGALAKNRIRLFSIALAPVKAFGLLPPTLPPGHQNESVGLVINEENLSALSWNSGGYMLFEGTTDPWKEYKLTDARLQELQDKAARMYLAIARFYRLSLRPPTGLKRSDHWELNLTDDVRKKVPPSYMAYPRLLEPCIPETIHP